MKPVVMVGRRGGDERVRGALDEALAAHELVKIRFLSFQDDQRYAAEALAASVGAEVVSIVGHVAVVFRQNAHPGDRVVHIPRSTRG